MTAASPAPRCRLSHSRQGLGKLPLLTVDMTDLGIDRRGVIHLTTNRCQYRQGLCTAIAQQQLSRQGHRQCRVARLSGQCRPIG